jgi:hypothetical protein
MTALGALFATLVLEHGVLLSGYFALGFISPMFWLRPLTAVLLGDPRNGYRRSRDSGLAFLTDAILNQLDFGLQAKSSQIIIFYFFPP